MSTNRFEAAYAAAGADPQATPWVKLAPSPGLTDWLTRRTPPPDRAAQKALVVGCGLGDDAAHLAQLGFQVTGFDIAPTAIAQAQDRFDFPGLDFWVVDWFNLPRKWLRAFDLVVEIGNVQALADRRTESFCRIGETVAPGGTMLVRCYADSSDRSPGESAAGGPPWPITRGELAGAEESGLTMTGLEQVTSPAGHPWWTVEFTRSVEPSPRG